MSSGGTLRTTMFGAICYESVFRSIMGLSSLTSLPVLTVSVTSCYDFNLYEVAVANTFWLLNT